MKIVFVSKVLLLFAFAIIARCALSGNDETDKKKRNFHDFSVKTIDGKDLDLSTLKGKKVLVVNTASKCGLTPQYEILQQIYETLSRESV